MKKYKQFRNVEELKTVLQPLGFTLNTEKFEEGSDYVSFEFKLDRTRGNCLVNMCNGHFFGFLSNKAGTHFDSNSTRHENLPWFKMLLEIVYTDKK